MIRKRKTDSASVKLPDDDGGALISQFDF